jgi:hypothetical protein
MFEEGAEGPWLSKSSRGVRSLVDRSTRAGVGSKPPGDRRFRERHLSGTAGKPRGRE